MAKALSLEADDLISSPKFSPLSTAHSACYTPLEPGAAPAYAPAQSISILTIRSRQ